MDEREFPNGFGLSRLRKRAKQPPLAAAAKRKLAEVDTKIEDASTTGRSTKSSA
jgi:hypothetical protein